MALLLLFWYIGPHNSWIVGTRDLINCNIWGNSLYLRSCNGIRNFWTCSYHITRQLFSSPISLLVPLPHALLLKFFSCKYNSPHSGGLYVWIFSVMVWYYVDINQGYSWGGMSERSVPKRIKYTIGTHIYRIVQIFCFIWITRQVTVTRHAITITSSCLEHCIRP